MTLELPNWGNGPILVAYAGLLGAADRQLPQRLHPALGRGAQAVGGAAAVALPEVRPGRSRWYDNIPIVSWLVLRGPLPRLRRADLGACIR